MRRLSAVVLICALTLAGTAAISRPALAGGYYAGYGHGYHGAYRYGYGHRYGHRYGYAYRGYGHAGAAVAVGLAGLFVGLMLRDATRYAPPPRTVYVPTPVRLAAPTAPAVARRRPARALPPGCLMIREYQTRLTVAGRQVEAYGDACLRADGSWRRSTPRAVPQ